MTHQHRLDDVQVASPCSANWEDMVGDDQVRFCNQCQLNVYNFANLTPKEITALIAQSEGRLCGRLYRRADGTLLTRDCPKGLQAVRAKALKVASLLAGAVIGLFSMAGISLANNEQAPCQTQPPSATPDPNHFITGRMLGPPSADAQPTMGEIALPEDHSSPPVLVPDPRTQSVPEPQQVIMGKIKVPDSIEQPHAPQ